MIRYLCNVNSNVTLGFMKKHLTVIIILLSIVIPTMLSCVNSNDNRLTFLYEMGIDVDSLICDTFPQPLQKKGYTLSEQQYKELFGYYGKDCRIIAIKPCRNNVVVAIAYDHRMIFYLFNFDGQLQDRFYGGLWGNGNDSSTTIKVEGSDMMHNCKGSCVFTSDSTFIVQAKYNLNDTLSYDNSYFYRVETDKFVFDKKKIRHKALPNHPRIIVLCGYSAEAVRDENEIFRKPTTDSTIIDDWNEMNIKYLHSVLVKPPLGKYEIINYYKKNPSFVLRWIYRHRHDKKEWISLALIDGIDNMDNKKSVISKSEVAEQIQNLPDNEARNYLEKLLKTK